MILRVEEDDLRGLRAIAVVEQQQLERRVLGKYAEVDAAGQDRRTERRAGARGQSRPSCRSPSLW